MMSSESQKLMMLKAELDADVENFKQHYEQAKADYDSVVRTIELLERQGSEVPQAHDSEISAFIIDLTGARNLAERLERIANNNNGTVNATKAAEILIGANLSRSSKRNLVSIIYRTLKEQDDRWEKVTPGTFKFRQRDSAESEIMLLNPAVLPRVHAPSESSYPVIKS